MVGIAVGLWAALILLGVVLTFLGKRYVKPSGADYGGVKGLGLAVELAASPQEFDDRVGVAGGEPGVGNRRTLRSSQLLDLPLIAAYAGLFFVLGGMEIAAGFRGAYVLGWLTRCAIVLAAFFDLLEDVAILRAAAGRFAGSIRRFGLLKWLFYFLASAALAPAYLAQPGRHCLSLPAGALLLAGGLVGLAGIPLRRDGLIEKGLSLAAVGTLALGLILVPLVL